jgi:hypothetical protein
MLLFVFSGISVPGQSRRFDHLQDMSASPLTAVTYAIWVYVAMGHKLQFKAIALYK